MEKTANPIDIAVDFDGTCVTHDYPHIGMDIGAVPVLRDLVDSGHNLILHTMRSGAPLEDAVDWFNDNDIKLYGVSKNPSQAGWTDSPKCYAQMYIDDAALGCPLIINPLMSNRPYVDWDVVRRMLIFRGYLPKS